MRNVLLLTALAALALAASGCGGGPSPAEESEGVGAGGARGESDEQPRLPVALQAGWDTDFSRRSVDLDEFLSGGPGKDGIPALDEPAFVAVEEASRWLADKEPVIELEIGEDVRAYPLQILIWHEIVNDEVGGVPVAVTFCPLCNTAIVFERRVGSRVLDFGTTGNLRKSDLVMYDRQTESWWQQFGGEALVGELTGTTLTPVPSRIVAWRDFEQAHPSGRVLSRETGFDRRYGENPYTGYDDVDSPPFIPVENADDDRLPPKERVVFVERGDEAIAVPFTLLAQRRTLEVAVGGEKLHITWRAGARSALDTTTIPAGREVGSADVRTLSSGERVLFDTPFWFAVAAFRPDVRIVGG